MTDISKTIDGFYALLKETEGIQKRELCIDKFSPGSIYVLKVYISRHIGDAAPKAERRGEFGVQVPLDRSRFYGGFFEKFSMNNDTGSVIGHGINVSLIDEDGKGNFLITDENLANHRMRAVGVSADVWCFLENYEARMNDFQQLVDVLTGKVDGRLGYDGREARSR